MIEHQMVDGQPAVVQYLKDGFEPATPDDYDSVRIIFADGTSRWAKLAPRPNGAMQDPSGAV